MKYLLSTALGRPKYMYCLSTIPLKRIQCNARRSTAVEDNQILDAPPQPDHVQLVTKNINLGVKVMRDCRSHQSQGQGHESL